MIALQFYVFLSFQEPTRCLFKVDVNVRATRTSLTQKRKRGKEIKSKKNKPLEFMVLPLECVLCCLVSRYVQALKVC